MLLIHSIGHITLVAITDIYILVPNFHQPFGPLPHTSALSHLATKHVMTQWRHFASASFVVIVWDNGSVQNSHITSTNFIVRLVQRRNFGEMWTKMQNAMTAILSVFNLYQLINRLNGGSSFALNPHPPQSFTLALEICFFVEWYQGSRFTLRA